jgi:hypothetical protein
MAEERKTTATEYLTRFRSMTLDEIAVEAAINPGSTYSQVAEIEVRRRVAQAQTDAANAQRDSANAQREAAGPLKVTAWATVVLALATGVLAIATLILAMKATERGNDEASLLEPAKAFLVRWVSCRDPQHSGARGDDRCGISEPIEAGSGNRVGLALRSPERFRLGKHV